MFKTGLRKKSPEHKSYRKRLRNRFLKTPTKQIYEKWWYKKDFEYISSTVINKLTGILMNNCKHGAK